MIDGVVVRDLVTLADERGFFREIARTSDLNIDVRQWSHAYRVAGVSNGWHIHRYHIETFYVVRGVMRLCLKDCRRGDGVVVRYPYNGDEIKTVLFGLSDTPDEYMEIVLSEHLPRVVRVPAGVAHGYKILQECDIVYTATVDYSTSRNDEGRINYDRWAHHDWTRSTEVG